MSECTKGWKFAEFSNYWPLNAPGILILKVLSEVQAT